MRTTKPDQHSATVKRLYQRMQAGQISHFMFAAAISHIWDLRRNAPPQA